MSYLGRREEAEEGAAKGAFGDEEILVSNGEAVGEEVAELGLRPSFEDELGHEVEIGAGFTPYGGRGDRTKVVFRATEGALSTDDLRRCAIRQGGAHLLWLGPCNEGVDGARESVAVALGEQVDVAEAAGDGVVAGAAGGASFRRPRISSAETRRILASLTMSLSPAWEAEIQRRLRKIEAGEATFVSGDEVFARAEAILRGER